jgi:superfamily I DNA/RNA helicase
MQSAKGLEFPVVAIAGFVDSFTRGRVKSITSEETTEDLQRQRRTLFVAMTRAMRSLLLVPPGNPSPLFTGFEPGLWNTVQS